MATVTLMSLFKERDQLLEKQSYLRNDIKACRLRHLMLWPSGLAEFGVEVPAKGTTHPGGRFLHVLKPCRTCTASRPSRRPTRRVPGGHRDVQLAFACICMAIQGL